MKKWRGLAALLLCTIFLLSEKEVYASEVSEELDDIIPCTEEFMFEDGDVVGFIGDSITQVEYTGISYQEFIYNYYITRYPGWSLEFRNLGTSSYTTEDALSLYRETRGIHDEAIVGITKAVVMFGMNEALSYTSTVEYINNMRQLVELLNQRGLENSDIILVAPTPYDQTTTMNLDENGEMKARTDDILTLYVPELQKLANELGTHYIDLHTPMLWVTDIVQDMNAWDTLTVTDSVHPNAMGNVLAGFFFLYQQGADKEVASVLLSEDGTITAENAEAEVLRHKGDRYIRLKYKPNSLPMAISYEFNQATQYFNVIDEISYEKLKVEGLSPDAVYKVYMAGRLVSEFTGKELGRGVNLTNCDLNPGQAAAKEIEVLNQQWQILSSDYRAVLRQATKEHGTLAQQDVDGAYEIWRDNTVSLHDQMYEIARASVSREYRVEIVSEDYHVWKGLEVWVWILLLCLFLAGGAGAGCFLLFCRKLRSR